MKHYDLCGLGNAIVDIIIDVSEEEFTSLEFEKGSMRLVEAKQQVELLARFSHRRPHLVSGGSVANSVIALRQLGGTAAYIGCVGDDRYGLFYKSEFESLGIQIEDPIVGGGVTGVCVALVTPDAERTMRTHLGVASTLSSVQVSEALIESSRWLFIEGYFFANPSIGPSTIHTAIQYARNHNTKIAITASEDFIAKIFGKELKQALVHADLLFANEREGAALTGKTGFRDVFYACKDFAPSVVLTGGEKGAWVSFEGHDFHVPAFSCHPIDLTGAGDMFAGAFFYGVTQGLDPEISARGACYMAMQIITRHGARLHSGVKEYWESCISGKL